MDKPYKIESLERKTTSTGKAVANVSLKDDQGALTPKVSIWSDFQNFANLKVGDIVIGRLYTNDKGYVTLYSPAPVKSSNGASNSVIRRSGGDKVAAEEVKQVNIRKNMEWKAEGQAYGNSVTNAVSIVTKMMERVEMNPLEIREQIIYFRDFLLNESREYQEKDITDKTTPF